MVIINSNLCLQIRLFVIKLHYIFQDIIRKFYEFLIENLINLQVIQVCIIKCWACFKIVSFNNFKFASFEFINFISSIIRFIFEWV